ncbi:1619_t:CDS:2 [Funneliformis mosseae]|uniref:1619_t:CDS:1 n=1 Tax=Funneliformis mosseae TaxID=27381 RepID=A0A9N9FLJ7_FUNMO|nr:1619_t:CDS:2 [Funneliformis mosseae]
MKCKKKAEQDLSNSKSREHYCVQPLVNSNMNPTRSKIQASNSENFSPSVIPTRYADNNILTLNK